MATVNIPQSVVRPQALKLDYRPKSDAPVKVHRLKRAALTDAQTDALAGHLLGEDAYDVLFTDDADIYKPDGSPLARLRYNVVSEELCLAAFPVWQDAARPTGNRGYAAGVIASDEEAEAIARRRGAIGVKVVSGTRAKAIKHDGTLSNTSVTKMVESGIVGYFDRSARYPYCRLTAYNLQHPKRFASVRPFIQTIDREFARLAPERYAAQRKYVEATSPDFFIQDTNFTTVTVNRNFQTAVHQDVGDLKEGFGVMTCLRRGYFEGCYFVYPKYRVALDMRTGCILCGDVHEWHGNTPMKGNRGMFERVSLVFYYREKMKQCGSAPAELARAKHIKRNVGQAATRSHHEQREHRDFLVKEVV
jgi:hypothetical protein